MKRIVTLFFAIITLMIIAVSCSEELSQTTVAVNGVTLSPESIDLEIGDRNALTATVSPSDATNRNVSFSSSKESVATVSQDGIVEAIAAGTTIVTVTTEDGGKTATCEVTVTLPEPTAVDLGLSVKWASFNLGAGKPEEYGGYFQWAGTKDVTDNSINLDWSNCPYHTSSSSSSGWIKYGPDDKAVLDPEDDVANVSLGGNWRMPTREEFEELYNNCTSEWTALNGVNGMVFTSLNNGNIIFLPAAGSRFGIYASNVGSDGCYWSSSLATDNPSGAHYLYFYSGFYSDYVTTFSDDRCNGKSVRPVLE